MMLSKNEVDMTAESKRLEKEKKMRGEAGNLVYYCVEQVVNDSSVDHVSLYLKQEEFEAVKSILKTYSRIVKVKVTNSKSIKGGVDVIISR